MRGASGELLAVVSVVVRHSGLTLPGVVEIPVVFNVVVVEQLNSV